MTGSGTNGSGLWIFTREQERDEALVQKVRSVSNLEARHAEVLAPKPTTHGPLRKPDLKPSIFGARSTYDTQIGIALP